MEWNSRGAEAGAPHRRGGRGEHQACIPRGGLRADQQRRHGAEHGSVQDAGVDCRGQFATADLPGPRFFLRGPSRLRPDPPDDWDAYVRSWLERHQVTGDLAVLTEGPSTRHPEAHNRMEIIDSGVGRNSYNTKGNSPIEERSRDEASLDVIESGTKFKEEASRRAVEFVRSGMKVGLGTGSTAIFATRRIAELLKTGDLRDILAFPTSKATAEEAVRLGIPMLPDDLPEDLDVTIDGADEVDPEMNLIKGGGGALLREKIVAQASSREIIVVDETKPSPRLGTRWPVPVEVIPFGWRSRPAISNRWRPVRDPQES